jgi:phosphate:Na+ symporter
MFHTLFNITNSMLLIWFVPRLEALAVRLIREDLPSRGGYQFPYIATSIQDLPELNVVKAEAEVQRMARTAQEMFDNFLHVFDHPRDSLGKRVRALKEMEELTDEMREELTDYLVQCSQESLSEESVERVHALMRVINELERIGDNCFNLIVLAERRYNKQIKIGAQALEEFVPYSELVAEFLRFVVENTSRGESAQDLQRAIDMEIRINDYRDRLKKRATRRIAKKGHVKSELLFIDILRHMEQIGDHALNIVQALQQRRILTPG